MNAPVTIVEKQIKGRTMYIVGDSVITYCREEAEAMLDETGLTPIACELSQTIVLNSIPPSAPVEPFKYKGGGHGLIKK